MAKLQLSDIIGTFQSGEPITGAGITISQIISINEVTLTVVDPLLGEFRQGDVVKGVISGAQGTIINASDSSILDAIGQVFSDDFSLSDFFAQLPVTFELPSVTTFANLASSNSGLSNHSVSFAPVVDTITNPANTQLKSLTNPTDRHVQNIANEPTPLNESEYPYNKSNRTEGGHLIEVDDTPGKERLLDQHVSGTYHEMLPDGSRVTKVVKDNYRIIAGDDVINIEGDCIVTLNGDIKVRSGGTVTIQADRGINMVTKGGFRVKAATIAMEAETGDFTVKAAGDALLTAAGNTNLTALSTKITSVQGMDLAVGQGLNISANAASIASVAGIDLAGKSIHLSANDTVDILSSAALRLTGDNIEIHGSKVNLEGDFNRPEGNDSNSADEADAATTIAAVPAAQSLGSGILYSAHTEHVMELTDDDDEAGAAAIKHGLATGVIKKEELDAKPPQSGETDTTPPPPQSSATQGLTLKSPLIKDLGGSPPPDNLRLSQNYTAGGLSKHTAFASYVIVAQHGLTITQITGNLQLVAENCLERIKAHFPDMRVTCGFRAGNGKSQHERGQAIDMQFETANRNHDLYFTIASWIKDNVPFDQLLLEYKTTGSKLPWIHISFNGAGNRHQALTFMNNRSVFQGLKNLA